MKTCKTMAMFFLIAASIFLEIGCSKAGSSKLSSAELSGAHAEIAKAYEKFLAKDSYYCEIDYRLLSAHYYIYEERPDKFWEKMKTKAGKEIEYLSTGKEQLMRTSDEGSAWKKEQEARAIFEVEKENARLANIDFSKFSDAKFLGKDKIGSKSASIYKYKNKFRNQDTMIDKIWIEDDTGLPLRIDSYIDIDNEQLVTSALIDYEKKIDFKSIITE